MGVPIVIPLAAIPSQEVEITLGTQPCRIRVFQKSTGLFLDLYVNGTPIILGTPCLNASPMVIDDYLGFIGDLGWGDTQGEDDPDYTGLDGRFQLFWCN